MNTFGIIFLVAIILLCLVEAASLIRTIVVKKKQKESLKQAQDQFQSLLEDNSKKEDVKP